MGSESDQNDGLVADVTDSHQAILVLQQSAALCSKVPGDPGAG